MQMALDAYTIVALVTNIPGPLAAARLAAFGADVTKIEPQLGDPLALAAPAWYEELVKEVTVVKLDLRSDDARRDVHARLARADLLITTMRAQALARLELDWSALHERYPRLSHVAIFGELPPHDDRAGHDLTYQARAGLIEPPAMPRTLVGDLAAAERAVSAALAALLHRERSGEATRVDVGIVDAAQAFAEPLRQGLTARHGPLGGGLDVYRLYRARDGWIALAALEAHFTARLREMLGIETLEAQALERIFSERTAAEWERVAGEHDLPLAAVSATDGRGSDV